MEKFIPREKLNKKARRALDRKDRLTWDGVKPFTRTIESKKLYNRKKTRRGYEDSYSGFYLGFRCKLSKCFFKLVYLVIGVYS